MLLQQSLPRKTQAQFFWSRFCSLRCKSGIKGRNKLAVFNFDATLNKGAFVCRQNNKEKRPKSNDRLKAGGRAVDGAGGMRLAGLEYIRPRDHCRRRATLLFALQPNGGKVYKGPQAMRIMGQSEMMTLPPGEQLPEEQQSPAQPQEQEGAPKSQKKTMTLTSSAFAANAAITRKYTGEGDDISPPLSWSGIPKDARALALICDDPDAPQPTPWVHWVAYNILPTRAGLPENAQAHLMQGQNDFGKRSYGGPMPPQRHGVHHYHFRLYALDSPIKAGPGLTKDQLLDAMKGYILAEGELVGTYERT
jgi:Raf kinase inhibitor-like YbhB/YbcL family protein